MRIGEGFPIEKRVSIDYAFCHTLMKRIFCALALGCGLMTATLSAQPNPQIIAPAAVFPQVPRPSPEAPVPELKRFDLDFPGGAPAKLVQAIEKSLGRPINVIIPAEFSDAVLPRLKLKNVTITQLFSALGAASVKSEYYITGTTYPGARLGGPQHQLATGQFAYGFQSPDQTEGNRRPNEDSIWFFYVTKPPSPPVAPEPATPSAPPLYQCWQLAQYLETYSIDDITTAIETSWKMMDGGAASKKRAPKMSFHKETKLLVVVADEPEIAVVIKVLSALFSGMGPQPPRPQPIPPGLRSGAPGVEGFRPPPGRQP